MPGHTVCDHKQIDKGAKMSISDVFGTTLGISFHLDPKFSIFISGSYNKHLKILLIYI